MIFNHSGAKARIVSDTQKVLKIMAGVSDHHPVSHRHDHPMRSLHLL